jgi:hypothetical protein
MLIEFDISGPPRQHQQTKTRAVLRHNYSGVAFEYWSATTNVTTRLESAVAARLVVPESSLTDDGFTVRGPLVTTVTMVTMGVGPPRGIRPDEYIHNTFPPFSAKEVIYRHHRHHRHRPVTEDHSIRWTFVRPGGAFRVLTIPPDQYNSPFPSSVFEFDVNSNFHNRGLQSGERV